ELLSPRRIRIDLRGLRAEEPDAAARGDAAGAETLETRRGAAEGARLGKAKLDGQHASRARVARTARLSTDSQRVLLRPGHPRGGADLPRRVGEGVGGGRGSGTAARRANSLAVGRRERRQAPRVRHGPRRRPLNREPLAVSRKPKSTAGSRRRILPLTAH